MVCIEFKSEHYTHDAEVIYNVNLLLQGEDEGILPVARTGEYNVAPNSVLPRVLTEFTVDASVRSLLRTHPYDTELQHDRLTTLGGNSNKNIKI